MAVSATGPGGVLITSDAVTRSQDGRVFTDTVDGAASPPTFSYTYDYAGRLVTAVEPNQTVNYGFGATTGCGTGSGVLADPGANSDRTSETITPTSGSPTTYRYCYGTGDQLLSSTDPSLGTIGYNSHGDTTSIHGETHTYDALDQHTGTTKGATSVTYIRDATGRIIERDLNGAVAARYSYGGPTDASAAELNGSNALVAATVTLPGGVMLTQQASGDTWSYTNIHGDVCATANSSGVRQGSTAIYDPFGNALTDTPPDNEPGSVDDQWLGGPQRPTEHETGLAPIVEMGPANTTRTPGASSPSTPSPADQQTNTTTPTKTPSTNTDPSGLFCYKCQFNSIVKFGKRVGNAFWHDVQFVWHGFPGMAFRLACSIFLFVAQLVDVTAGCDSGVASGGAAFVWCVAAVFGLIGSMVLVDKEARALRRAMYAT